MVSGQVGNAVILLLLLALPLSALVARRLPLGTVARYAMAWVAIFAVATLIVVLVQGMSRA